MEDLSIQIDRPEIQTHGVEIVRSCLNNAECDRLIAQLPELQSAAGTRDLLNYQWCQQLAHLPQILKLVEPTLGRNAKPRRAILFDKSPSANWVLGFHQDVKIAVAEQYEVEGFTSWSVKAGVVHCKPPQWVLEQCLAVRIHLDDCPASNGALRVLLASHRSGVLPKSPGGQEFLCEVSKGDIILIRPLTWHASSKSVVPGHRRVIHIEYSSATLPSPLAWAY